MNYILKQYNKGVDTSILDSNDEQNLVYMTPITTGEPRRTNKKLKNVVSNDLSQLFNDECIFVSEDGLKNGYHYFFHGKVKRLNTDQSFNVKLINYNAKVGSDEQYIKSFDIISGKEDEWVDITFIFTPASNFDTIVFELSRIREDYAGTSPRFPIFIYQELSIINNIIQSKIGDGIELVKIGVQSHPSLMMCINGEQINIGRTGVYELKNGIINVNMFSVVAPAQESELNLKELEETLVKTGVDIYNTTSKCIFNSKKNRTIDSFTLDYMYESEV